MSPSVLIHLEAREAESRSAILADYIEANCSIFDAALAFARRSAALAADVRVRATREELQRVVDMSRDAVAREADAAAAAHAEQLAQAQATREADAADLRTALAKAAAREKELQEKAVDAGHDTERLLHEARTKGRLEVTEARTLAARYAAERDMTRRAGEERAKEHTAQVLTLTADYNSTVAAVRHLHQEAIERLCDIETTQRHALEILADEVQTVLADTYVFAATMITKTNQRAAAIVEAEAAATRRKLRECAELVQCNDVVPPPPPPTAGVSVTPRTLPTKASASGWVEAHVLQPLLRKIRADEAAIERLRHNTLKLAQAMQQADAFVAGLDAAVTSRLSHLTDKATATEMLADALRRRLQVITIAPSADLRSAIERANAQLQCTAPGERELPAQVGSGGASTSAVVASGASMIQPAAARAEHSTLTLLVDAHARELQALRVELAATDERRRHYAAVNRHDDLAALEERHAALSATAASLETELRAAERRASSFANDAAAARGALDGACARADAAEAAIAALQQQVALDAARQRVELEAARAEATEAGAARAALQGELLDVTERLEAAVAAVQELSDVVEPLREGVADAERQRDAALRRIASLVDRQVDLAEAVAAGAADPASAVACAVQDNAPVNASAVMASNSSFGSTAGLADTTGTRAMMGASLATAPPPRRVPSSHRVAAAGAGSGAASGAAALFDPQAAAAVIAELNGRLKAALRGRVSLKGQLDEAVAQLAHAEERREAAISRNVALKHADDAVTRRELELVGRAHELDQRERQVLMTQLLADGTLALTQEQQSVLLLPAVTTGLQQHHGTENANNTSSGANAHPSHAQLQRQLSAGSAVGAGSAFAPAVRPPPTLVPAAGGWSQSGAGAASAVQQQPPATVERLIAAGASIAAARQLARLASADINAEPQPQHNIQRGIPLPGALARGPAGPVAVGPTADKNGSNVAPASAQQPLHQLQDNHPVAASSGSGAPSEQQPLRLVRAGAAGTNSGPGVGLRYAKVPVDPTPPPPVAVAVTSAAGGGLDATEAPTARYFETHLGYRVAAEGATIAAAQYAAREGGTVYSFHPEHVTPPEAPPIVYRPVA